MLAAIINACARNRFMVFMVVLLLTLAGIWSLGHVPLDALPDISDVQVVVHTSWPGQPPDIIENQVTYPIVASLLAAPHVKAVRAQTMPGDSYVYVVFEDGTDLYWARSRVVEYLQQITGRLPAAVRASRRSPRRVRGSALRKRGSTWCLRAGSGCRTRLRAALARRLRPRKAAR